MLAKERAAALKRELCDMDFDELIEAMLALADAGPFGCDPAQCPKLIEAQDEKREALTDYEIARKVRIRSEDALEKMTTERNALLAKATA